MSKEVFKYLEQLKEQIDILSEEVYDEISKYEETSIDIVEEVDRHVLGPLYSISDSLEELIESEDRLEDIEYYNDEE